MKKVVTIALTGAALAVASMVHAAPLRILLVNDDGCHSPGITRLQSKLTAQGYDVWLVAPATNQSAIGSAITFKPGKEFEVQKITDRQYCFPGTPSDSVDFGLHGLLRDTPPDLVISGVNDGPNTGAAQLNSGTLAAAVRALRFGYPAIAASVGNIMTREEMKAGWPQTKKYWPESVDYVVRVVDTLAKQQQPGQPLLPAGSGLSINYPPLAKSEIKGVKYVANELHPTPQFYYDLLPDGKARQSLNQQLFAADNSDTDGGWLSRGWVTYTLFDGQWNAPQAQPAYQRLLNDPALLQP